MHQDVVIRLMVRGAFSLHVYVPNDEESKISNFLSCVGHSLDVQTIKHIFHPK